LEFFFLEERVAHGGGVKPYMWSQACGVKRVRSRSMNAQREAAW